MTAAAPRRPDAAAREHREEIRRHVEVRLVAGSIQPLSVLLSLVVPAAVAVAGA